MDVKKKHKKTQHQNWCHAKTSKLGWNKSKIIVRIRNVSSAAICENVTNDHNNCRNIFKTKEREWNAFKETVRLTLNNIWDTNQCSIRN